MMSPISRDSEIHEKTAPAPAGAAARRRDARLYHSFTHSLTRALTYLLTRALTHLLTRALTYSFAFFTIFLKASGARCKRQPHRMLRQCLNAAALRPCEKMSKGKSI